MSNLPQVPPHQACVIINLQEVLCQIYPNGDPNVTLRLSKHNLRYFLAVLFGLVLFACGQSSPDAGPTLTVAATSISQPSDTPTPRPSSTPLPPMAVLLAPPEADPLAVGELQSALADLAAQAGLRFQTRPSLAPVELDQVQVLVALPPNPGLGELVAAAPGTQFLAVGFPELEPATNLSVVAAQAERLDQVAFLAGYTAATISEDWRVAVVSEAETVAGKVARKAFTNGVTFYCGLCRPPFPPFPTAGYPLSVELIAGASPVDWQAALTYLSSWQVSTVFVQPVLAEGSFLSALADAGINFILAGPAPAGLEANWVASLGYTDALADVLALWPGLVGGQGGQRVDLPLGFSQVNPDLLSPGRQRLAESMLADLLAGFIGTGVDPLTGESP